MRNAMMLTLFTIACGIFFAAGVDPSTTSVSREGTHGAPATQAVTKITFKNSTVQLKDTGFNLDINLALLLPRGSIYRCDILNETFIEKDRYYVLNIEATSRDNNGNGECGAGIEKILLWFHVGEVESLQEIQMFLYSSCWQGLGGDVSQKKNSLSLVLGKYNELAKRLNFDPARPELGFTPAP